MPGDAAHDAFRGRSAGSRNRIYFNGAIGRPNTTYVWVRTDCTRREGSFTAVVQEEQEEGEGGDADSDTGVVVVGGGDGGGGDAGSARAKL